LQAVLARFKRHIIPLLTTLLGEGSPIEITISENNLCINDIPVGEWQFISNFEIDDAFLKFDYVDGKFRLVGFNPFNYSKVDTVAEFNKNGGYKLIYENWRI